MFLHIVSIISVQDCSAYTQFANTSDHCQCLHVYLFFLVFARTPQFIFVDFILLCWFWWTKKEWKNNHYCQETIIWFRLSKWMLRAKYSCAVSYNHYDAWCLVFSLTTCICVKNAKEFNHWSSYMYQQFVFSKGTRQRMLILLQQAMGQQWSTTVQLS